jgi:hypothetical protein
MDEFSHSIAAKTPRSGRHSAREDTEAAATESSLSEYEAARLANIARNSEVLTGLGINTTVSAISAQVQSRTFVKPEKRQRVQREPVRRSTRGKDADGKPVEPLPVSVEPVDEHEAPAGPIDLREGGAEHTDFAETLQKLSAGDGEKKLVALATAAQYAEFSLGEDVRCPFARVAPRIKVVKERIFSIAFHPSPLTPLVVAADKWGQVGFLDLRQGDEDRRRVFAASPHARPVSALVHSTDAQYLYSCSYDGTVRRFDYKTGIFELLVQGDEMLSHLALSADANRLYVASNGGDLLVLDPRASPSKASMELDLHDRKIATVDGHPLNEHVFVTASNDTLVKVWDIRKAASKGRPKALQQLQHSLAVTSAYYSTGGGEGGGVGSSGEEGGAVVVTTCNDNLLRFWQPHHAGAVPLAKTLKHNNNTGRYITNFRAVCAARSSAVLIGERLTDLSVLIGERLTDLSVLIGERLTGLSVRD